ncbi:arsenite methyltransferase-like [Asterias rubens]|uniref:arsenite methyltransferase-like n=1 Tax=Asterias rubens TaxID=7604 RepID=UPI001455BF5E|nr:arsenite methyltransferase-like [Asterias rubens]
MADCDSIHDNVKDYYGSVIQKNTDLQTNACNVAGSVKPPLSVRNAIASVHDEVVSTFYGCGLTIPSHVEGLRVLDLGSGTGMDCFAISKLVGENGSVVGVDMTDNQLAVAIKYVGYHTKEFGYSKKNVEFVKGYIEKLGEAGLQDNQFDLIVSNCVVNLSPDKKAVLKEAYRVLKPGGEMYFSDVYTNKVVPEHLQKDKMLWGECIAGAMTWQDLVSFAGEVGFATPRLVSSTTMEAGCEAVATPLKEAGIRFVSATYRLFKLTAGAPANRLEVNYLGNVTDYPDELPFDALAKFKKGCPVNVSGEVVQIVRQSRYSSAFTIKDAEECPVDPFKFLTTAQASSGGCCGPPKQAVSGGLLSPSTATSH